jgi:hypothetical protein
VGRTVLENCAANIGYPVEHLGWNLQASMLMTCLNAKGWTVEYSEVSF